MRRTAIILTVLALLLLVNGVGAMSSANYKLDWLVPLTGGGGGPASSTHYAVNLTIGQTVIGASSSASYQVGLGYWYGAAIQYKIYLPIVLK